MSQFSEEDAKRLQILMAKVIKEAEFKLGVNQFVELFNEFDWVNQQLIPKIKAHIFQVEKLIPAKEEEPKKKKKKAK